MQLQLWRNATLLLTIEDKKILVDPMLGPEGSIGPFPWTNDLRPNPIVDLPFSAEVLAQHLESIDAVMVTHLHPDHWDAQAIAMLGKQLPIICPESIAGQISNSGFQNIIALREKIEWNGLSISLTKARHGVGEIGERMGQVIGFLVDSSEGSVYLAGDTVWCQEVSAVLDKFEPDHVIVAGGAATFSIGAPVTMTFQEIYQLCHYAPYARVWVTHMEAVSPCRESRVYIRNQIAAARLTDRCFVPDDGQIVQLLDLHQLNSMGCKHSTY
jgi:L-ascorbate metabolism protein UlaG (beta-lactamase superfamily)